MTSQLYHLFFIIKYIINFKHLYLFYQHMMSVYNLSKKHFAMDATAVIMNQDHNCMDGGKLQIGPDAGFKTYQLVSSNVNTNVDLFK